MESHAAHHEGAEPVGESQVDAHVPDFAADREAMERISESMAELMRRMLEIQEEMQPFLAFMADPGDPEESRSDVSS